VDVKKKKNLGRLIYRNDADVLGSCHLLFLANHRSLNQIALMEKENLKFFFKSSVIREEILFVNFKFSFSIRAIWFNER
jgi:hypothetical protein